MKLRKLRDSLASRDTSGVFRGMMTLALGTGSAKLIGILSTVLLTRLYQPEDYAVLAIYSSLVNILVPVLSLRYALAIPLPRRDAWSANVFALSVVLIITTGGVAGIAMWLAGPFVLHLLSMDVLIPWRGLVVAGAVAVASYELLAMWATRQRQFGTIAKTQILQAAMGESLKIILGLLSVRPFGLMLGQLVSQSGGVSTLTLRFSSDYRRLRQYISPSRLQKAFRLYHVFPAYRLPSQVLLIISAQAPLLLSALYFEKAITGQLSLALTLLAIPTALMADSIGRSYFAEISRLGRRRPKEVLQLTHNVLRRVLLLSLLPTIFLMACGKWIFQIAFGPQWAQAGVFASALALLMVAQFMNRATVSYLMSVFDGQKQVLFLNIQRIVLTVGCFLIGRRAGLAPTTILVIYAATLSAHYVIGLLLALKKVRRHSP